MNKVTKKLLSVIVAMTLVVSVVATNGAVSANQQDAAKTVNVMYSVYYGDWILKPQILEVSADLSDKYADQIGYNDTIDEPSILDATIAAHIAIFGENFEEEAGDFKLSSGGWVVTSFGIESDSVGYRLNGETAYGFDEAVTDNSYVEYMFYQDTTGWSDKYVSFESTKKTVKPGSTVELTALAEGYDSDWNVVKNAASGLTVKVNDEEVGKTDENGKISFVENEEGTYVVTLAGTLDYASIFSSYCIVTVANDEGEVTTPEVTSAEVTTPEETSSKVTTPEVTTSKEITPTTTEVPTTKAQTKEPSLKKVTIKSAKNIKKSKAKIKIKKVSKATGYQYKYSVKKNFKKYVVKNTKKTSFITKKLKKGKTYYVKVRAYVKVNGTKYYGSWSSVKKVKIKK